MSKDPMSIPEMTGSLSAVADRLRSGDPMKAADWKRVEDVLRTICFSAMAHRLAAESVEPIVLVPETRYRAAGGAVMAMRVELADAIRAQWMADAAFRAGYEAMMAWGEGRADEPRPTNPHAPGSTEEGRWELGAEQAELEMGSPDSWRDGGAGMDLGVLREVWAIEHGT